jgi:hypothetical protein
MKYGVSFFKRFHSSLNRQMTTNARREIICADTCEWIKSIPHEGFGLKSSVFTSLPDISELPHIYHVYMVEEYKKWFSDTIYELMMRLTVGNCIVLLQSDTRMMTNKRATYEWVDKSFLASEAAVKSNCTLLWHKLVLLSKDMNNRSTGRPCYSHLLCYVKNSPLIHEPHPEGLITIEEASKYYYSYRPGDFAIPDVFYRGEMFWTRGIGADCCYAGLIFLKEIVKCDEVIDPFCGCGTVLAMANFLGMHSIGIDISPARCKKSRKLLVTQEQMDSISPFIRSFQMPVVEKRKERSEQRKLAISTDGGAKTTSDEELYIQEKE